MTGKGSTSGKGSRVERGGDSGRTTRTLRIGASRRSGATTVVRELALEESGRRKLERTGFNPYDKPIVSQGSKSKRTDLRALSVEILAKRKPKGG